MDRDEALKLLRGGPEGVAEWNRRREAGDDPPSLARIDHRIADLRSADLRNINLSGARLAGANLSDARLCNADLSVANLFGARLSRADLSGAVFREANLIRADLSGAVLRGARLYGANLDHAILKSADLSEAYLLFTVLVDTDLGMTQGLETVKHGGPSSIGIDTLYQSKGKIPAAFLRGAGVDERTIRYAASLLDASQQPYLAFISYSHSDQRFAQQLHDRLQSQGVRCWRDAVDARIGEPIASAIDRGFRATDRVVLCCSESALNSQWVDRELNKTFAKEKELRRSTGERRFILLPLNIDGYLFRRDGSGSYLWHQEWADEIRNRICADFTGWEADNAKFEAEFEKVVRALRTDKAARERPPESRL